MTSRRSADLHMGPNPYMSLGPQSTVALMAAAAVAPVATAYQTFPYWTTALAVDATVLVGIVLGHRLADSKPHSWPTCCPTPSSPAI